MIAARQENATALGLQPNLYVQSMQTLDLPGIVIKQLFAISSILF